MQKHLPLLKQITLFGFVGGGSFLIDVCVTTALYDWTNLPVGVAGIIGFTSPFFFNFPINRKHVFNHTERDKFSLKVQVILYIILSLINLGLTGVLMQVLVNTFSIQVSIAKAGLTALIAIWNFLIFRFFIFSKRPIQDIEGLIVQ